MPERPYTSNGGALSSASFYRWSRARRFSCRSLWGSSNNKLVKEADSTETEANEDRLDMMRYSSLPSSKLDGAYLLMRTSWGNDMYVGCVLQGGKGAVA